MPDLNDAPQATTAPIEKTTVPDEARNKRAIRRLTIAANIAALPVAVLGAVLSFHSLSRWALPLYGPGWHYVVPFVVDFVIVSASLKYIAGAKAGRVVPGWRLMAHAGVGATLVFNAQAAENWTQILGLAWPPLVWSLYVELTAAELIGEWREQHTRRRIRDKIPLRLWITAPVESARVWLRMERRLEGEQAEARFEVGIYAAALAALDDALPRRDGRRVRGIIRRQLRTGSLQPHDILIPLGWHTDESTLTATQPRTVLRAVLRQALARRGEDAPAARYNTPAQQTQPAAEPGASADNEMYPDLARWVTPAPATPAPGTPAAATGDDPPPSIDLRDRVPDPEMPVVEEDNYQTTGDRHEDAVLIWRRSGGKITGRQMATRLGELGWPGVSERNALRIIQQVRDAEQAQPTGVVELVRQR